MVEIPDAVKARSEAHRKEYGQWVATGRIYVNGALAFTRGMPVPASHVKRFAYDRRGLVEAVNKKGSTDAD